MLDASDVTTGAAIHVEDETLRQGFTQIPNAILRRRDISPGAKLAYVMLLSYAWQKDSCFPGQEALAEDMGVTSRSVRTYLQQLVSSGLLIVKQRGLGLTNVYYLPRFQPGPENISGQSGSENISGLDRKKTTHLDEKNFPTKKTQLKDSDQEDPEMDPSNFRKPHTSQKRNDEWDEARLTLVEYIEDLGNEFLDTASGRASTTRAVNLFRKADISLDDFITAMTEARAITKQYTATIKRRNVDGDKTKMAYFFSILEDRLGLKEHQLASSIRQGQEDGSYSR